jgi:hypothetical protein
MLVAPFKPSVGGPPVPVCRGPCRGAVQVNVFLRRGPSFATSPSNKRNKATTMTPLLSNNQSGYFLLVARQLG